MFGRREMKGHDSSAAERESDMRDLLELLPGCIEDHRTARWLPDPDRADH